MDFIFQDSLKLFSGYLSAGAGLKSARFGATEMTGPTFIYYSILKFFPREDAVDHEAVDLQLVFGSFRQGHDLPKQLDGLVPAFHRRKRGGSHANHVWGSASEVACLVKRIQGFRQITGRAVPPAMVQAVDSDLLPEFHTVLVLFQGLFEKLHGLRMAVFILVEQVGSQQKGVDERRIENRDQFQRICDPVPETGMRIGIHLNPEQIRREFGKPELPKKDDETWRDGRISDAMRMTGMIVSMIMAVMLVAGMVFVPFTILVSRA